MTTKKIIEGITDWVQEAICGKIELKVPDDNANCLPAVPTGKRPDTTRHRCADPFDHSANDGRQRQHKRQRKKNEDPTLPGYMEPRETLRRNHDTNRKPERSGRVFIHPGVNNRGNVPEKWRRMERPLQLPRCCTLCS